jgi:hypothetical protein
MIPKACLSSLLQTAINASFLLFPFATILSYSFLHSLLHLHALKLHINSKLRSLGLPILLILSRPLIELPDVLVIGVRPAATELTRCLKVSKTVC